MVTFKSWNASTVLTGFVVKETLCKMPAFSGEGGKEEKFGYLLDILGFILDLSFVQPRHNLSLMQNIMVAL